MKGSLRLKTKHISTHEAELKTLLVVLQSKSRGQDLFDQIMYHIDLVETDYFGLQFMDTEQVSVSNKLLRISPVDWTLR